MPPTLLQLMLMLFALVSLILFGGFALVSFRENERRAGWIASGFTLLTLLIFLTPLFLTETIQLWVVLLTVFITLAFFIAMLLPIGKLNLAHEQAKDCLLYTSDAADE